MTRSTAPGTPHDTPESAQLCVVRHGETDWNIQGILQGWIDVPINDLGRQQARELAASYAPFNFAAVWSSPLVRASETADIIVKKLGLPPTLCHEGLKERNFGAIQGVPKAELAELNPLLLQQILRRNPAAHFEEGETMDEFADRVLAAVREVGARHRGQRVLVVVHGWVMDVITRHIGGLSRCTILNHKRKNGESLWLEVDGNTIAEGRQP
jgi:probable phosphoglycerate mutase